MKRDSLIMLSICLFGLFIFSVLSNSIFKRPNNGTNQNRMQRLNQNIADNNLEYTNREWHKTFDRHDLYAAAYGNGTYVAVGADGIIKISSDGQAWTIASSHSIWFKGLTWGKDKFVAVGSLGKIYVSSDGQTWTEVISGTTKDLTGIAWNGSMYVAVGDKGTILTSNDGLNWMKRPLKVAYSISNVISGKGRFIATQSETFNVILESSNGIDWNTIEPLGQNFGYFNLGFNGDSFIMNGTIPHQGGYVTVKSADGIKWTQTANSPKIRSIASNGKKFAAIGDSQMDANGILSQNIYISDNGTDWATNAVKWDKYSYSDLRFIYWGGDKYIGVRYTGEIYTSADALHWNRETSGLNYTYENIIWNGRQLLAYNTNGGLLASDNGDKWNPTTVTLSMDKPIINMFYLENKYIIIAGSPAKMFISSDGVNWSMKELTGLEYCKILWSQGKYLLITGTAMYISSDAITWEKLVVLPNSLMTNSIAYNGKIYVSVGGQGVIYGGEGNQTQPYRIMGTSSNMKDWSVKRTENVPSMNGTVWANGKFTAVGEGGTILNSIDGLSWTQVTSGTVANLLSIIWDGNRYIVSGEKGTILLSKDGVTWNNYKSDITSDAIGKIAQTGSNYIGISTRAIFTGIITQQAQTPADIIFKDIQNHWARDYINQMISRKLVSGIGENTFAPDRKATRAEFTAIIVRALDLKFVGDSNQFIDIKKNDWYYESIYAAFDNGIIKGYEGRLIGPDKVITREEAMAIIVRAMQFKKISTSIVPSEMTVVLSTFIDKTTISKWGEQAVAICVKNSIVQGNKGYIKANNNITRAEVATIILRMLQRAE